MIPASYLEKWKAKKLRFTNYIPGIILREDGGGFTLLELLVVIFILGTLAGIAIPVYTHYIEKARLTKAILEVRILQKEILLYEMDHKDLPNTLNDIGRANLLDPWGNAYEYLNYANIKEDETGKQKARKDRFLKPLNSDYDLYSMGKDGESKANLSAKVSYDDIVRANDGNFVGLASEY